MIIIEKIVVILFMVGFIYNTSFTEARSDKFLSSNFALMNYMFIIIMGCININYFLVALLITLPIRNMAINSFKCRPPFKLGITGRANKFLRNQPGIYVFLLISAFTLLILLMYYA